MDGRQGSEGSDLFAPAPSPASKCCRKVMLATTLEWGVGGEFVLDTIPSHSPHTGNADVSCLSPIYRVGDAQPRKNSTNAGASTSGATPWVWPARVRYCAWGRRR